MKLSTILLYSTTDYRWLNLCLEKITKVSNEVIIPMCSHFFNGEPENQELLDKSIKIIKNYPSVKMYNFDWSPGQNNFYWEGVARILGTLEINKSNNWVLYLDTDEIIDPLKFQEWVNSKQHEQYDSIKLSNYWYFRDIKYQATTYEDSIVLVRKDIVTDGINTIINPNVSRGREQCHEMLDVRKIRNVKGVNGKPMIHHYSWVRTKDEMLKKISTWGHNKDRNWVELVEEEFSREFNGTDFIHGYTYKTVNNFIS